MARALGWRAWYAAVAAWVGRHEASPGGPAAAGMSAVGVRDAAGGASAAGSAGGVAGAAAGREGVAEIEVAIAARLRPLFERYGRSGDVRRVAAAVGVAPATVAEALARFTDERDPAGVCRLVPECPRCPVAASCAYARAPRRMRDLPAALRPRERVLAGEEAGLTDEELLALVIQSGRPGLSARDLARRLLDRAGGLAGAAEWGTAELARVPGIGPAKTAALRAAFLLARRLGGAGLRPGVKIASSADVCRHLAPRLRGARREEFLALLLDSGHHLIREAAVTSGTLDQSLVHPRETFAPAIEARAAAVIIAHNHPSGDPQPSAEDVEVTARLREAGRLLGIQLLDHVIIGGEGYYSFAENGLLEGGAP